MLLPELNFPKINTRFQNNDKEILQIFDIVRKKFVVLTPEEWVRQHVIHFLINFKRVPISCMAIEKQLILNNTKRRTDILIYNTSLHPVLIVECKSSDVNINQETINQALRYNLELKVPYVFLSNGLKHICLQLNTMEPIILEDVPDYHLLNHTSNL